MKLSEIIPPDREVAKSRAGFIVKTVRSWDTDEAREFLRAFHTAEIKGVGNLSGRERTIRGNALITALEAIGYSFPTAS